MECVRACVFECVRSCEAATNTTGLGQILSVQVTSSRIRSFLIPGIRTTHRHRSRAKSAPPFPIGHAPRDARRETDGMLGERERRVDRRERDGVL
ncbi:hypothetical protein C0Q70_17673 [Pomacea canaliculata]|uniref:Uncharacterized protein n=1 Tax=Pomacea canaliculata TaxID=400727 RepID=A0A2T7NL39_POMCA|nr:hypothetical protein C0Q70_17673 [Pomacea canaliculata]